MFNWLKLSIKYKAQDRFQTFNHRFLQDPAVRQQIHRLQMLVGVTREDFQVLYIATIEQYIKNFSRAELPTDRSVFAGLLDNVILALKKRRGYLLPLGADSETSFREREEWTFAVFTAGLFKQFDNKISFDFAKTCMSSVAFSWLERNKNLFEVWQRYLQGDIKDNIFNEIVGDRMVCVDDHKNYLSMQIANTQENNVNISIDTTQSILVKPLKSTFKPPHFSGDDFWAWLKESITKQTLQYNQIDSVVHGVELGLFVCMPDAMEIFFANQVKKYHIDINTITLAERIELTKAIKKHPELLRNPLGSRTHVYCRGQWQDRKLLSGLVIPIRALFSSDFMLPVNADLVIDPLTNL